MVNTSLTHKMPFCIVAKIHLLINRELVNILPRGKEPQLFATSKKMLWRE